MDSPRPQPVDFAAYKAIRDEIAHEDNLMGTRFNWFISAQAFLLTALAIAHVNGTANFMPNPGNDFYFPLIPLLAISSCLLILLGILGGAVAIQRWRAALRVMLLQDPTLPAIGRDSWIMRCGWIGPVVLPLIFCAAWGWLLVAGYSA